MTERESKALAIARLLLIFCLVTQHFCLLDTVAGGLLDPDFATPVYDFISSKILFPPGGIEPLFFISGWLFFINVPQGGGILGGGGNSIYARKLRSRVRTLLVPYIFWNCLWLAYTLVKNYHLGQLGESSTIALDSPLKILQVFFYCGEGPTPLLPIAFYMWFVRDLMLCALLTPLFHKFYQWRYAIWVLVAVFVVYSIFLLDSVFPIGFVIGGWFGYKRINPFRAVVKMRWAILAPIAIALNLILHWLAPIPEVLWPMVVVNFFVVLKFSYWLSSYSMKTNISSFSMWFYVSHAVIVSVIGHITPHFLPPTSDANMTALYLLNGTLCIAFCIISFYLLSRRPFHPLFAIMTGGRG